MLAVIAAAIPVATAHATAPAERFNAPGQGHANVCAKLDTPLAALRFPDGTPTGFTLTNDLSFEDDYCPFGTVRLDYHEAIPSPRGSLVFHRGGLGYVDRANVKYGALATSDLAQPLPNPTPSGGGRGAACELAPEPAYLATIRSVPPRMKYKRPQDIPSGNNSGASFLHYGDPASDQGDRHDIHYSYLTWSFVNVRGGGMVRALIAPGKIVRTCDVEPVTMDSYDKNGDVNGTVTARYVRITVGSCPLYGWMMWSHDYLPERWGPVTHATPLATPPPRTVTPDDDCPRAAPPRPVTVRTGGAVDRYGQWALKGRINTHRVTTSYHFQLGTTRAYGTTTPAEEASPNATAVGVASRTTEPLEPGTTYHYRLVATNVHGTRYGRDRTFRTAGAARTAGRVVLTNLRVRRSRIRFRLSTPARVRFSFERRLGSDWWAPTGGTFKHRGRPGRNSVTRPSFKRGRYRVTATPRRGTPKATYFSLR